MEKVLVTIIIKFFLPICLLFHLSVGICTDNSKVTIFAYHREILENEELEVQPKSTLSLVCCHPSKATNLEWFDVEKNELIEIRDSSTPVDKSKYSFIDEKERLLFIIQNVTRTDNSTYKCRLKSPKLESSIKLKVGIDLPNTQVQTNFQFFAKGQPYKIKCIHESFMESPIMWFYYDPITKQAVRLLTDGATKFVNVTDNLNFLTVLDTVRVPKSVFCQVRGIYETDGIYQKRWIKISWKEYSRVNVKVNVPPNNEVFEEGRAEFVCEYDVLPDSQQVVAWSINGSSTHSYAINQKSGRNSMIINKYQLKSGSQFTCKVISNRNFDGLRVSTSSSKSLTPSYIPKPRIVNRDQLTAEVEKGKSVTLRCQVKDYDMEPELFKLLGADKMMKVKVAANDKNYNLKFQREPDSAFGDLIYTIQKTELSDRGVYICSVSSKAGVVKANGTLTIRSAPLLDSGYKNKIVYFYQQRVSVTCVVMGFPLKTGKDNLIFEVDGKIINNKTNNNEINPRASVYNVTFWVKLDPQQDSYTGYCVYKDGASTLKEEVKFQVAPLPPKPEIDLVCAGNSEAVFKVKKKSLGSNPKPYERIVREYYTTKMKNLQPSNDGSIGISSDENVFIKETESYISVAGLKESTEYIVEWSWANAFARVGSLQFTVATKKPSKPQPVSDVSVWSNSNPPSLIVQYKLNSQCIRTKVPEIKSVKIRVKRLEEDQWTTLTFNIDNKMWERAGRGKFLKNTLTTTNKLLIDTNVNYIVEVAPVNEWTGSDLAKFEWTRTHFKAGTLGPSNQGYTGPDGKPGGSASSLQLLSKFSLLIYSLCLAFGLRIRLFLHC